MVEQETVNLLVVGSIPTPRAKEKVVSLVLAIFSFVCRGGERVNCFTRVGESKGCAMQCRATQAGRGSPPPEPCKNPDAEF